MSLSDYIQKISEGKPVNVGAFKKALPKEFKDDFYHYFNVRPFNAKLSYVEILQPGIERNIKELFIPSRNRVEAAFRHGDSHKHGVKVGYLMVYRESSDSICPDVVVLANGDEYSNHKEHKDQVLIIENEENFFEYTKMLKFASHCTGHHLSLENTDVIFGSGNRINKQVLLQWIDETYSNVYCAFDYDLGGLRIFDTLAKTIPRAKYVQLSNWERFSQFFKNKPKGQKQLVAGINLAKKLGFLDLANVISSQSCFLEQESLLVKEFNYEH